MRTKPKWAVNAANRFVIPMREAVVFDKQILPPHKTIDIERFHAALVALQLRTYRRGYDAGLYEGGLKVARFFDEHSTVEVVSPKFNRAKA